MNIKSHLEMIKYQKEINYKFTTLHTIETIIELLNVWKQHLDEKNDHSSSDVILSAIDKSDEALNVLLVELKKEIREALDLTGEKNFNLK